MAVLCDGGVATSLPGLATQPCAAPARSSCAKELNAVTLVVHLVCNPMLHLLGLLLLQYPPIRSTCKLIHLLIDAEPIVQEVLGHGVDDSVQYVDVEVIRLGVAKARARPAFSEQQL